MKKTRIVLLVVVVILQLLMAFSPFIPYLNNAFPAAPTLKDLLDWEVTAFGIFFAILTTYIGVNLALYGREQDERQDKLLETIGAPVIRLLQDHDFYVDFLAATRKAKNQVNIMYLATHPPDHTKRQDRLRYYSDLIEVIKRSPRVNFRRIMRDSPENRVWLAGLLEALAEREVPNADIAVLREAGKSEMPLALSVQTIDADKSWLVALAVHEGGGEFRDIYVESADFNKGMRQYYERLWDRSEVLMSQGRLTEDGSKYISSTGKKSLIGGSIALIADEESSEHDDDPK